MSPEKTAKKISLYLPRLGLSSLIICLGSGLVLSFYYRPMGNVFQNVEEITTLVPFGRFFRQLHYASGELFVILMLFHTVDHFFKERYRTYSQRVWNLLIFSLCLCLFALFTGFVLKGDKEGFFAGQIFMNILRDIPFAGERAAGLFIRPGSGSFFLPYLYHCLFLPLAIVYLLRGHIREWLPDRRFMAASLVGLLLYALLVDPHLDIPPEAPVAKVQGPWFFLGIQSLLKIIPPLLAGLIIPGLFLCLVIALPSVNGRWRRPLHYTVIGSFCFYGMLTIRAFFLGP